MAKQPENKISTNTTRRKTGVVRLSFKSESVYLYMRGASGKNLNNAMYRIGELFKMTSRSHDKKIFNDLCNWFDNEIVASTNTDIKNLSDQLATLRDEVDTGLEFINVKHPVMDLDVELIHKSHGEIFKLLNKIDFLMDDIETLLLTGIDDDQDIEASSRANINLILGGVARKIFTLTKPGKRNGGPFNAVFFIEQLQKGVFTLYPEDEPKVETNLEVETKPEEKTKVVKPKVAKSKGNKDATNDDVNLSEAV